MVNAAAAVLLVSCLLAFAAAQGAAVPTSLGRRSLLAADDYRPGQVEGMPSRGFYPGSGGAYMRTRDRPRNQWYNGNNDSPAAAQDTPGRQDGLGGTGGDGLAAAAGNSGTDSDSTQSQPVYQQAAQPTAGRNGFGSNSWNRGNSNRWGNGWGSNNGWGSIGSSTGGGEPAGSSGWGLQGNPSQASWGGGSGRSGRGWRDNKGDSASLGALTGSLGGFSGIPRRPIAVNGAAGTLVQGIRRRGNARAAAQSLAQAYSSGQADAAAQAVAAAATDSPAGAADSTAAAEAVAEATINHPTVAPGLLAKSASYAVSNGQTDSYADTMADAFAYAHRKKHVPQFTTAVANAISTGGAPTRYVYGQAIATAIAEGGDSQAAVAEATASAFCAGGSTASAWASAYAVALSQDSRGCLVLNQAKALAQAQCGNGASQAFSQAQATSTVLGFCGLLDMIPGGINMGWSGGSGGSNSGNAYGGLVDSGLGGK